jgi:hypothetical protein
MPKAAIGLRLREKLGLEASDELTLALEDAQADMLSHAADRFDTRLAPDITKLDASLRVAIAEGFAIIRKEMGEMRVDIIRWSFLFWIGQVIAMATLFAYMLRPVAR